MKRVIWIVVFLSLSGCASTDEDPLGRLVEKQGELNPAKTSDPFEKWLDEY